MDRTRNIRRAGWLLVLAVCTASGCQTVKTPEEKIANSNIPTEFKKVSMPDYVIEPPDLVLVEVLEALPGRPISGERLVRPDGKISLGFYGEVYIAGLTISEAKEKVIYHLRKYLSDEGLGLLQMEEAGPEGISQPKVDKDGKPLLIENFKDCDRVFLDVTAYNSKNYYVLGDVAAPGRLPVTGNETVLDALQFAGGLLPTAASQNIRLVRPAPPGACCEQVLPVNLAAIMSGGDSTTNYQLMPETGSSSIATRSSEPPSSSIAWPPRSRRSSTRFSSTRSRPVRWSTCNSGSGESAGPRQPRAGQPQPCPPSRVLDDGSDLAARS